jgi:hypothetical protein
MNEMCGVCGELREEGVFLESGRRRPDGTTPCDNFICLKCLKPGSAGFEVRAGNVLAGGNGSGVVDHKKRWREMVQT